MGWFSNTKSQFNWNPLESIQQWSDLWNSDSIVLVFKHSTRCSISSMALSRFEREWAVNDAVKIYYLDLLSFREISNQIAEDTSVFHQSPQVIVFKNKSIIYQASHNQIDANEIQNTITSL